MTTYTVRAEDAGGTVTDIGPFDTFEAADAAGQRLMVDWEIVRSDGRRYDADTNTWEVM